MKLPPDAYERTKALREDIPEISPAASRLASYPRNELPPHQECATEPPTAGPCAPQRIEDVDFACPHVEPRKPCCDSEK